MIHQPGQRRSSHSPPIQIQIMFQAPVKTPLIRLGRTHDDGYHAGIPLAIPHGERPTDGRVQVSLLPFETLSNDRPADFTWRGSQNRGQESARRLRRPQGIRAESPSLKGDQLSEQDLDDDQIWFRSKRIFHTNDGWYVDTGRGELGPVPHRRLTVIKLARYIKGLRRRKSIPGNEIPAWRRNGVRAHVC